MPDSWIKSHFFQLIGPMGLQKRVKLLIQFDYALNYFQQFLTLK